MLVLLLLIAFCLNDYVSIELFIIHQNSQDMEGQFKKKKSRWQGYYLKFNSINIIYFSIESFIEILPEALRSNKTEFE